VSGAGPISVNYVNAGGVSVDVSSGGTFEMGYCGCCAPPVDSSAIDILYYTDGDSILNGDTILYKNYDNHVFLSGNGDNFTGRMGDFNRPFRGPWGAQDSLSAETNLSFLAYQGMYANSGNTVLTRADTFLFLGLPGSSIAKTGAATNYAFITDQDTGDPRVIHIDAPQSGISFAHSGSSRYAIGVYEYGTSLYMRAKYLSMTGGRNFNSFSSPYVFVEMDSLFTSGGIPVTIQDMNVVSGTMKRSVAISIKKIVAQNTTDIRALLRYQKNSHTISLLDSLSSIVYSVGEIDCARCGAFMIENDNLARSVSTRIDMSISKFRTTVASPSAVAEIYIADTSSNVSIRIEMGDVQAKTGILTIGESNPSPLSGQVNVNQGSIIDVRVENAYSTGGYRSASFSLDDIYLGDSSVINIHCDYCVIDSGFYAFRFAEISAGANARINISGNYFSPSGGVMVRLEDAIPAGLIHFQDANFVNGGGGAWMESAVANVVSLTSGLWSNSDSIVNVEIQGNELWGFSGCSGDFEPLQEILDNLCDSIAAIPADLNVAEDDLVANGSHTTDWLDHTIEFDFTGAPLDTIVFAWPSPDGEVQGLYISDGAQEMALLMNDVRGTDFANIINYNLADEIVFGNTGDTTVTQADKWFADVVNMVRGDTIRSVMAIDSDDEIKLKYVPISGRVSDTTDGSGDIVIPLGVTMGSVNFTALVGARGTTFQQAQVISNTATNITVRVLDDSGAPITGTAVVVDWMVMDY